MNTQQSSRPTDAEKGIGLILVVVCGGTFVVQAVRFVLLGSDLGMKGGTIAVLGVILAILGAALMN